MPSFLTPDVGLLFWMSLAFLIVLAVLAKYGFPVIIKMVDDRKKFIDKSLQNARMANEKLANIKTECNRLLQEAREKQDGILRDAVATQQEIIAAAKKNAQAESQKMIAEAVKQIQMEKDAAMREIRSQVADLSVGIAEKILQHQLQTSAEQEQLVNHLLDDALAALPAEK